LAGTVGIKGRKKLNIKMERIICFGKKIVI
jgi:hypothetical protein